jgi:hypothetical protein
VKFTTQVYLVPMLRMNGAVPPLSLHTFAVWKERNLSLRQGSTCRGNVGSGDSDKVRRRQLEFSAYVRYLWSLQPLSLVP